MVITVATNCINLITNFTTNAEAGELDNMLHDVNENEEQMQITATTKNESKITTTTSSHNNNNKENDNHVFLLTYQLLKVEDFQSYITKETIKIQVS